MAFRLVNEHAVEPRHMVPVCTMDWFKLYWLPGAEALGLTIVPLIGILRIRSAKNDTQQVGLLISELARLREWFAANTPEGDRACLLARVDNLVKELELISKQPEIDISIG